MRKVSETKLNRYMDRVEEKYIGKNPILRWISKIKFKKFCKTVMKSSPTLGELWYFADFIKLAERLYFFPNKNGNALYSSRSYCSGENGFIINDKKFNLKIVVKLLSDDQLTRIQITRLENNMTTEHTFVNNSWGEDRQSYDEVLIDNAIGIINSYIIGLMNYCWNIKGSFDDINKIIQT